MVPAASMSSPAASPASVPPALVSGNITEAVERLQLVVRHHPSLPVRDQAAAALVRVNALPELSSAASVALSLAVSRRLRWPPPEPPQEQPQECAEPANFAQPAPSGDLQTYAAPLASSIGCSGHCRIRPVHSAACSGSPRASLRRYSALLGIGTFAPSVSASYCR